MDMHSSWPHDGDADKARDCGDDGSNDSNSMDGSSCAVVRLCVRRRSNRRRRRCPCNVPISHDASNLSALTKSKEKSRETKETTKN